MRRRGVTLIMVAGVLSILAALGAGFYTITISQQKSATNYGDSVHADMMARAGIYDAIARLREGARLKIEDCSDAWYMTDWLHGGARRISYAYQVSTDRDNSGQPLKQGYSRSVQNSTNEAHSDQYSLEISDASSKININACDNLGVLLDNLCRVIGPPLVAADLDRLQPAVWGSLGAKGYSTNPDDKNTQGACYCMPTLQDNLHVDITKPPVTGPNGTALYGDGYAIARYRAKNGRFTNILDIKAALTVVSKPDHPELEQLERELKFAELKDYITIDSWVDTSTVCTGKFEWINKDIAVDRDKTWIEDDPANDPKNHRGSLRGSYVAIVTGHAAGTLRRIKTNGVDWIQIEPGFMKSVKLNRVLEPGPLSSYMIVAKEDALTENIAFNVDVPKQDANGNLVDDPDIDYDRYPLCIHRAPVNINTASDKVLTALFLGINITHAHYMSIGTQVDVEKTYDAWYKNDPNKVESRISTLQGLKRVPVSSGKIVYDKPFATILPKLPSGYNVDYLNNFGNSSPKGDGFVTEAHELALRVILARQSPIDPKTGLAMPRADPFNEMNSKNKTGYHYQYLTGPFYSWDDFYFRVVQPWDLLRYEADEEGTNFSKRGHAAPMLMAHFNPNTDILKFNPGIEWIDRWGRNFTEMEPVMAYANQTPIFANVHDSEYNTDIRQYIIRNMRYKADEMIDKTDLNRSTTEFCFDSRGIFEIRSTGRVMKSGVVLAERKYEALVQVYDVWRETTQRQFVQGTISEAAYAIARDGKLEDFSRSGKIARDSQDHGGARLALDTLPEPLVPIRYRFDPAAITRNTDVVDINARNGRDCYGNVKAQKGMPDVLANNIQPASYDGQIVLATNTSRYGENNEEKNTFLASFNGDLDTDTSVGNGREQAKSPADRKTRVLDTCGLLGVLNDMDEKHIDFDPQDANKAPYTTFRLAGFSQGLQQLDPANYWENVMLRQGDLRPEGVWLGYVGVSGNDGTLKYLIDVAGGKRKNFNPEDGQGATNGATICMWFKPNWCGDDNRYHEFFNADNAGRDANARYFHLLKGGGQPTDLNKNDLTASFEDHRDTDCQGSLYGGTVADSSQRYKNDPAYRVQPFRWSFVGGVYKYNFSVSGAQDYQSSNSKVPVSSPNSNDSNRNNQILTQVCRPFINTQKDPEGSRWKPEWFWSRLNDNHFEWCDIGMPTGSCVIQQAAWDWADGGGGSANVPVFGCNNLNKAPDNWLYRYTPIDGTMAVVDEYKLSKSKWDAQLISKAMTVSRYYLPKNPDAREECPTFTSQSLLQSLKGFNAAKNAPEVVRPMRVAWTCFTPRFMHEFTPNIGSPGPFDYLKYNVGILQVNQEDKPADPYGVFRPTLLDYQKMNAKQAHAVSGIEVELLDGLVPLKGESEVQPGNFVAKSTFTDPNVFNRFPIDTKIVNAQDLHYRVRFRYPIDPHFGGGTVNPSAHYMLDTPVFDDISITYEIAPRISALREISE